MIEYDPHDWRSHLLDIRGSMVREITGRVLTCVLWAALVQFFHEQVWSVGVSPLVHTLIGVPLGLLLVFRTNSAYDRFWEGRKLWGGIVNESRNLARSASVLLAADPGRAPEIVRRTICLVYSMMYQLRGGAGLGPLAAQLPPQEAANLLAAQHTPLATARTITELLDDARRQGIIDNYLFAQLDGHVLRLIDYLGGCERIQRTPMPFAYMVHTRRALIAYCYTLPFALADSYGWWSVLMTLLVCYALMGIEEIGVEIEGPFGEDDNDLPLGAICQTIEHNLLGLLAPPATVPLPANATATQATEI